MSHVHFLDASILMMTNQIIWIVLDIRALKGRSTLIDQDNKGDVVYHTSYPCALVLAIIHLNMFLLVERSYGM